MGAQIVPLIRDIPDKKADSLLHHCPEQLVHILSFGTNWDYAVSARQAYIHAQELWQHSYTQLLGCDRMTLPLYCDANGAPNLRRTLGGKQRGHTLRNVSLA